MKFCPYCGNELREIFKFCPKCGHNLSKFIDSSEKNPEKEQQPLETTAPKSFSHLESFNSKESVKISDGFSLALEAAGSYSPAKSESNGSFGSFSSDNKEKNDFNEEDFYLLNMILDNYIDFISEVVKRNPGDSRITELNHELHMNLYEFRDSLIEFYQTGHYPKPFPGFLIKTRGYIKNLQYILQNNDPQKFKGMIELLDHTHYCLGIIERGEYQQQKFRNKIGYKNDGYEDSSDSSADSSTPNLDPQTSDDIYVAPDFSKEIKELEKSIGSHAVPLKISCYNPEIDYWKELDKLIGLGSVKTALMAAINDYKLQLRRKEQHPDLEFTTSLNSLFVGNPGTGKTTVARLVAGILRQEGIIKGGHCVEVDASNLISTYVGMSSQLTKLASLKAIDGILFIDEAYSIANNFQMSSGAGPGKDVIDTLTPIMENNRGRLNVILAGYEKEMSEFIQESNTGFPSRFKLNIQFEDYSPEEMLVIFRKILQANKYVANEEDLQPVKLIFEYIYRQRDKIPTFANARTVRSLFEKIKERASQRMMTCQNVNLDQILIEDMALSNKEIKEALGVFQAN